VYEGFGTMMSCPDRYTQTVEQGAEIEMMYACYVKTDRAG
jgi:hypothetical protein